MSSRQPYHGPNRKLVVAFDVGTTYSGISYAVLDPGLIPDIQGVTRFPAQQKVGGDSKIPSILYYDKAGNVRAVGAEAVQESFLEQAEDEGFIKVEWFKLHLRPKALPLSDINDVDIPPLPANKTPVSVLADFLRYLYQCTQSYIQETYPNGPEFWVSVKQHIDFVFSLPNGWEGAQQAQMRRAAVMAGLVTDEDGQIRVQFVTEGEASLHFCINRGLMTDAATDDNGVIIVDAGGGTVDLSAYSCTSANVFEEIAPPECRLQGSVFVSRRAHAYLEEKLRGSRYGSPDDINHMANVFDKTTKLTFRDPAHPCYIRFGSGRDKDLRVDIKSGQIKLPGHEVGELFHPSIREIVQAIKEQRQHASKVISSVFLVGGFAASDFVFLKLREHMMSLGLKLCRPDGHLNKAVADGAVSFYLDHFVSARVSSFTYGVECCTQYDPTNPSHLQRSHTVGPRPSGRLVVPNLFSSILKKGTRVSEDKEFREEYYQEGLDPSSFKTISTDILCYRGRAADPTWIDVEPEKFSNLCTVVADTSQVAKSLSARRGRTGRQFYSQEFCIVLLFGLTELKAQLSWKENGVEMRSPATILYDHAVEPVAESVVR